MELQIEHARLELEAFRAARRERMVEQRLAMKKLEERSERAAQKVSLMIQRIQGNRKGLSHYAEVIKNVRHVQDAASSYIVALESQVLRSLHNTMTLDRHKEDMRQKCECRRLVMKRLLIRESEKATSIELQLINHICRVEAEKKEAENKLRIRLQHSRDSLESFHSPLGLLGLSGGKNNQKYEASMPKISGKQSMYEASAVTKNTKILSPPRSAFRKKTTSNGRRHRHSFTSSAA